MQGFLVFFSISYILKTIKGPQNKEGNRITSRPIAKDARNCSSSLKKHVQYVTKNVCGKKSLVNHSKFQEVVFTELSKTLSESAIQA